MIEWKYTIYKENEGTIKGQISEDAQTRASDICFRFELDGYEVLKLEKITYTNVFNIISPFFHSRRTIAAAGMAA